MRPRTGPARATRTNSPRTWTTRGSACARRMRSATIRDLRIPDGAQRNPATTDMRHDELDNLREALIDRRRQLSDWIERLTTEANADSPALSGEITSIPTHPADQGSATYEQEQGFGLAEKTAEEGHEIDEALSRIDLGTYGICENCGRPINIDRRPARPSVVPC